MSEKKKRQFIFYFKQINADKIYVEADTKQEAYVFAKGVWRAENHPEVESVYEELEKVRR